MGFYSIRLPVAQFYNGNNFLSMGLFDSLEALPDDPILGITTAYRSDDRPQKVNLGVGTYRSSQGKPYVMAAVREAEKLLERQQLDKEYLKIVGDGEFAALTQRLSLGEIDRPTLAIHTLGASGALSLGSEALALSKKRAVYISDPTWPIHHYLMGRGGHTVDFYRYWSEKTKGFDLSGMLEALNNMQEGSVVLLHGCCHNPTGIDPTWEEWLEISSVMKERRLIPFFDFAYQGLGSGVEEDARAVRHFVKEHPELLIALSHSKNFGLYGERVGALIVVTDEKGVLQALKSRLERVISSNYRTPARHGAEIVKTVLGSDTLAKSWKEELVQMRQRVVSMREELTDRLNEKSPSVDWEFLRRQRGFFSYLGLTSSQVEQLRENHAIYMTARSRINVAGLTEKTVPYVAEAISCVI